jgi:RHS repeat-associated protein
VSTTTYAYDNSGNVTQKTTDGTTTTYVWDYANRLTALGVGGATTTFGYDAFGQRVLQTGTSTTTIYPFKWVSVASSTGSGAQFATTTDYVFNGDTLLATIDQETASGNATGTPATHYIHPDHLGSTNVVTNATGAVEQTLDYLPYGGTRINTGQNAASRQYIGQFADQSTLDYLNARYYDSSREQFLSEDPIFLGDPKVQNLANPQSMNTYSYANGNPITNKDPKGLWALLVGPSVTIPGWGLTGGFGVAADLQGIDFYFNGGLAVGGQLGAAQITTQDLDHQYSISGATFETGGGGVGVEMSQGVTYYPHSTEKPKPYQEASVGLRGGLGAGTLSQVSFPIVTWGPSLQNYISSANRLPTSQWISGLPPIVVQGGITYYRSSSGLLSLTPQSSFTSSQSSAGAGSGVASSGSTVTSK